MELKKFKLTYDKDWEQNWLNEMCQKGWGFTKFFAGVYTFEPCEPGEYIYQVDLLPGSGFTANDPEGYAEFMEDTGVEVVCRWFRWIILRKRAEDGPFEIYTDTDSKLASYKRIRTMLIFGLLLELACCSPTFIQLLSGRFDTSISVFLVFCAAMFLVILIGIAGGILKYTKVIQQLENSNNN